MKWLLQLVVVLTLAQPSLAEAICEEFPIPALRSDHTVDELIKHLSGKRDYLWCLRRAQYKNLDIFASIKKKITTETERRLDPERKRFVDAPALAMLQELLTAQLVEVKRLSAEIRPMVERYFVRYKPCAHRYPKRLEASAERARTGTLAEVAQARIEIVDETAKEQNASRSYESDARTSMARLAAVQSRHSEELERFADLMSKHGYAPPDTLSKLIDSLNQMATHAANRANRAGEKATNLLVAIAERESALLVMRRIELAEADISAALRVNASARFIGDLREMVADLWSDPPRDGRFEMPLLGGSFDAATALLARESECESAGAGRGYRESGCRLNANEFAKARRFIDETLPQSIKIGIDILGAETLEDPFGLRTRTEAALSARNTADAVRAYDAYVRSLSAITH